MDNPRNIHFQIAAIRDLIPSARSEEVKACAEQGLKTLEWLAMSEQIAKMIVNMRKDRPEMFRTLSELLNAFPDAQPEDIRRVA